MFQLINIHCFFWINSNINYIDGYNYIIYKINSYYTDFITLFCGLTKLYKFLLNN